MRFVVLLNIYLWLCSWKGVDFIESPLMPVIYLTSETVYSKPTGRDDDWKHLVSLSGIFYRFSSHRLASQTLQMSQEERRTSPGPAVSTPSTADPGSSSNPGANIVGVAVGGPVPPSVTMASAGPLTPASSSGMIYTTSGQSPPGLSAPSTSETPAPIPKHTSTSTVASSFLSTITSTLASIPASLPSSGNYPPTLDSILSQITNAGTIHPRQSLQSLSHTLRHGLPKESRDAILAGILPGGQDPLGALDVRHNTLGVLWIL